MEALPANRRADGRALAAGPPSRLQVAGLLAVVAVVAVAALIPIYKRAWWANHDWVSYPVRLIEYVRAWRMWNLFPRWCPDLYGGYGAPLFNFYPPGVFTAAAPFVLLGATPALALKVAVTLFTILGGAGAFLLAERVTRRLDAAFVAAIAFVLMPYRHTQLLVRGDLAEYCAIALVPVVFWLYLRLPDVELRKLPRDAFLTALFHAATQLTHTLTGQWGTELVAIWVVVTAVRCWRRGRRVHALVLPATVFIAGGLSAIYVIPALLERDLVQIGRMLEGSLSLERNFVEPSKLVSPGFWYVGRPILLALVAAPLVWVVLRLRRREEARALWWWWPTAALVVLMLPITMPLWRVLPFSRFMQFPWRLLGFIAVCGAVTLAALWSGLLPRRNWVRWPAAVLVAGVIAWQQYKEVPVPKDLSARAVPVTARDVTARVHSTVVSDEYLPREVPKRPLFPRLLVSVAEPPARLESTLRSGIGYKLKVSSPAPEGRVTLELHYFPAWRVKTLSGPARAELRPSKAGLVELVLPKPGHYHLAVQYRLTAIELVATVLSLLFMLGGWPLLRRLVPRS